MKLHTFAQTLELEPICIADDNREVKGAYAGDLLSWVMTRLDADSAWITIMNNTNIVAVASLADAACIILTENSEINDEVIDKAKIQSINIYRTKKSSFEISYMIGKMLYAE